MRRTVTSWRTTISPGLARRLLLAAALCATLLVVAPAGGDPGDEKQRVDDRIGELRQKTEQAEQEEAVLSSEISAASARVRDLQGQVDAEQRQLDGLESQLAAERANLTRLNELYETQTTRLETLQAEHASAVVQLEERVREIYMQDTPDVLSFVFGATSFGDLLDNIELLNDIGRQDARIVDRVADGERKTRNARRETAATRETVQETTRLLAQRVSEQRAVRDRLVVARNEFAAANEARERTLARVRADHAHDAEELDVLQTESAALAAQNRAAQAPAPAVSPAPAASPSTGPAPAAPSSSSPAVSSSGFIFPVSGPVVSGFGPRGGAMHEGIDIIAAFGTPVVACASGTVIRSDYGRGYGNVVVIDHGGGLTTTYAHNSSLVARVGQSVSQGQVIAYVGSTGNSSGPHVHLEFRINGTAVDPFNYL